MVQKPNFSEESLRHVIDILAGIKPADDGTQMEGVQTGNPFGDQAAIDATFKPFDDDGEAEDASKEPVIVKDIPDGFISESDSDDISDDELDNLLSE